MFKRSLEELGNAMCELFELSTQVAQQVSLATRGVPGPSPDALSFNACSICKYVCFLIVHFRCPPQSSKPSSARPERRTQK